MVITTEIYMIFIVLPVIITGLFTILVALFGYVAHRLGYKMISVNGIVLVWVICISIIEMIVVLGFLAEKGMK